MKLPVYKAKSIKMWTLFYRFGPTSSWDNWHSSAEEEFITSQIIINIPDSLTDTDFNFSGRLYLRDDKIKSIQDFSQYLNKIHQLSLASFEVDEVSEISKFDTLEIFTFPRKASKDQILQIIKDKKI